MYRYPYEQNPLPVGQHFPTNHPPAAEAIEAYQKRQKYLRNLGFREKTDPFLTPVAEQEIERVENISQFFHYFYAETNDAPDTLQMNSLRRLQHSLIFGNPGTGKTTLRLVLDAACRTQPDQTLVVNGLFNEDFTRPLSIEEHGNRLAQALAIDFVLQVIEQIPGQIHPNEWFEETERRAALLRLIQRGGSRLRRFLRGILTDAPPSSQADPRRDRMGLGIFWKQLARVPVQHVALTEPLRDILAEAVRAAAVEPSAGRGFEVFWSSVEDAKQWGFRQVFVLVDGIDSRLRSSVDMTNLVLPLLSVLQAAGQQDVYFKFFIPLEIREEVNQWCVNHLPSGLYSNMLNATIEWTSASMKQFILQRFHSAGSHMIDSLDQLADPSLENGLEEPLIAMANGSPRKLLELLSDLIQTHAERNPDQIFVDRSDFNKIKENALAGETKR